MMCHACGRAVEPGQRFCSGCGASLRNVTEPTVPVATTTPEGGVEPTEQWAADNPEWATTGTVPATDPTAQAPATASAPKPGPADAASQQPARSALDAVPDLAASDVSDDAVWALTSESYTATGTLVEPPGTLVEPEPPRTAEMPAALVPVGPASVVLVGPRFRFGPVMVCALLATLAALIGSFTTAVGVSSDTTLVPTAEAPATFRTGTWMLDDLADNMSIAVLIAALLMMVGGIAAGFGWRWGSGLAGGAGLGLAGLVGLAIGLAQFPIDAAKEFAAIPSPQQFTLTITRDVGYWLLVAAAALGIVLFFASINDAFGDRRPGLNPLVAALGALATVVAAFGPMLPEGIAIFSDNWYLIDGPGQPSALLLAGRLLQLGLLLITGLIGYLCVRRWGLGLAIGGALPIVWLAVSTLFELTDTPVGPAFRNPGASDTKLHGVTIIGISAIVAMAILAIVAAYDQTSRERR